MRRYLGSSDPLRERVSVLMRDQNPFAGIVGVVGDVREGALDKPPEPTVLPARATVVSIHDFGGAHFG